MVLARARAPPLHPTPRFLRQSGPSSPPPPAPCFLRNKRDMAERVRGENKENGHCGCLCRRGSGNAPPRLRISLPSQCHPPLEERTEMNQHCEPTVNTRTLYPLKLPARLSDTGDAELRRGLYVDCETTGLSFERDQAIEVAMLPFIETALALRTARPELPVAATLTPRSASPPTSPRHASPGCSSPATTTPRRRGRISTTTSSPTGATRSARASARRPGQAFTTEPHDNALSVHRRARLEGNARHRGQGRSGKENGVHRARAGTVRAALTHPPRTPRRAAARAHRARVPRAPRRASPLRGTDAATQAPRCRRWPGPGATEARCGRSQRP